MEPLATEVLSARALDDLDGLLEHAERHLSTTGIAIFPKGANWKKEDDAARLRWSYTLEAVKSETNPEATILKIGELTRV